MAPVDLDTAGIHRVVEQEGGCIAWGGAVKLSPADDVLIRIERALDIDSEGLGQQRMAVLRDRRGAHAALSLADKTYLRLITSPERMAVATVCTHARLLRAVVDSACDMIFGG